MTSETLEQLAGLTWFAGSAVFVLAAFLTRKTWSHPDDWGISIIVCWLWPLVLPMAVWEWITDRFYARRRRQRGAHV